MIFSSKSNMQMSKIRLQISKLIQITPKIAHKIIFFGAVEFYIDQV